MIKLRLFWLKSTYKQWDIWNAFETCWHANTFLKKLMRLFLPLLRISVSEICVHMYIGVSVCVQERVSVSVHVFPSVRIAVDRWHFATVLLIASWLLGGQLLDIRLVVMASVAFALARCDYSDFVCPFWSVRTLELYSLGAGVSGNAAVIRWATSPPFSPQNWVWHQVSWKALTRTHQLFHRFGAAARSIGYIAGRTQLPAA